IGVYALERLARGAAAGAECLARVVERLGELAVRDRGGITWFTPPEHLSRWQRERCPGGYFNFGLAHGVPGVIALLGGVCSAGVAADQARPLLEGAVPWLLDQRLGPEEPSSFRAWIAPGYE